jgi:hypothetical protein
MTRHLLIAHSLGHDHYNSCLHVFSFSCFHFPPSLSNFLSFYYLFCSYPSCRLLSFFSVLFSISFPPCHLFEPKSSFLSFIFPPFLLTLTSSLCFLSLLPSHPHSPRHSHHCWSYYRNSCFRFLAFFIFALNRIILTSWKLNQNIFFNKARKHYAQIVFWVILIWIK